MNRLVLISLTAIFTLNSSFACTSFLLENGSTKLFAKNYDWDLEHGYVLINKRNVRKRAIQLAPEQKSVEWTAKYGSATFNQYGRELPNSGINEKGLAVEILWLDTTKFPPPDDRPVINELQWIQYQLDSFATVAEVLQNADKIRIESFYANTHYLVCDRSGECATFEYIDGNLVTHTGNTLNPKLITNNTQEVSSAYLAKFEGFGGKLKTPSDTSSLSRYVRAATLMKTTPVTIESAFDILVKVRQGIYTKWNVVYNLVDNTISYRTLSFSKLKSFKLNFDYSCKTPVVGINLESKKSGDVSSQFATYTPEMNNKLIEKSFATLGQIGKKLAKGVAAYPASTVCTE